MYSPPSGGLPNASRSAGGRLLDQLVKDRLVQKVGTKEEEEYSLSHEYMVEEVEKWRDSRTEIAIQRARDILNEGFIQWNANGILMDAKQFPQIIPYEEFLNLNEKEHTFLRKSKNNHSFKIWIGRVAVILITVTAIIATVLGIYANNKTKEAQEKTELAIEAANVLSYSLVDRLNLYQIPEAMSTLTEILQTNATLLDEIYADAADPKIKELAEASKRSRNGEVLWLQGNIEGARVEYQQSIQMLKALVRKYPESSQISIALANSYGRLAMLLSQLLNEKNDALDQLEQSKTMLERLLQKDPKNVFVRKHLANTLQGKADIQWQLGKKDDAITTQNQLIEVAKQLVLDRPKNTYRWLNLQVSYEILVNYYWENKNLESAQKVYEDALKTMEELASDDPQVIILQDTARMNFYSGLGAVRLQLKDPQDAIESYDRVRDIMKKLDDSTDTQVSIESRYNLIDSYAQVANVQQKSDEQIESLKKVVAILNEILDINPQDDPALEMSIKDELVFYYHDLGGLQLRLGDILDTIQTIEKEIKIIEEQARANPLDIQIKYALHEHEVIRVFLGWLANPVQGWEDVMVAINKLPPQFTFIWDFSTIVPVIERQDPETQQIAQNFIAFFKEPSNLPTLIDILALEYIKQGRHVDAVKLLIQALKNTPANKILLERLKQANEGLE